MAQKHLGRCPFCKELVRPTIIEENIIRRDKCQCPECFEYIYICRSPLCEDYAKGGTFYDDELCPSCTKEAVTKAPIIAPIIIGSILKKK